MNQIKRRFALCVDNTDYEASLIPKKVYQVLPDEEAERDGIPPSSQAERKPERSRRDTERHDVRERIEIGAERRRLATPACHGAVQRVTNKRERQEHERAPDRGPVAGRDEAHAREDRPRPAERIPMRDEIREHERAREREALLLHERSVMWLHVRDQALLRAPQLT